MSNLILEIIPATILILLTLILPILLIIKKYNSKKDLSTGSQGSRSSQGVRGSKSKEYLPYEYWLKRVEWREKRQKILNRDNNKCVYCGEVHNLQVHHKYYSKYPNGILVQPWDYPDDALITLCVKCHTKVHNKKKIKTYYRSYSENYLT